MYKRVLTLCCVCLFGFLAQGQDTPSQSDMLGLRTTVYFVDNLSEAKTWYSKAFGIPPYFDEPYYVGFDIRGYELALMPGVSTSEKTNNVLAYWGVDDIQKRFNDLIQLGAKPHTEPQNVGGDIMVAVVIDPFGNQLGLIYNPLFQAK